MSAIETNKAPRIDGGKSVVALIPTIVASAICSFVASQRLLGFVLLFFGGPLVVWLLIQLSNAVRKPLLRMNALLKIGVWVVGLACIAASQIYLHVSSRTAAQNVVDVVNAAVSRAGECPTSLETLGFFRTALREKVGPYVYSCSLSGFTFGYVNPFTLQDMWSYDSKNGEWKYAPD